MTRRHSNPRPSILHLITRVERGGSEQRLIDALGISNLEQRVLAGEVTPSRVSEKIESHVPIELLPSLKRDVSPLNDARTVTQLRRLISESQPDIIHSHQSKAGILSRIAIATMPASQRPHLVHSLSMASFGPGYSQASSAIFRNAERLSGRYVDRYLAVGADLIDSFVELGLDRSKFVCVRSSQELRPYRERARHRDLRAPVLKLIFVGALEARKGIAGMPSLIQDLNNNPAVAGQRYELTVVGEGSLRDDLMQQSAAQKLPIESLGYRTDVAELLSTADMFVLPSQAEGLPQVLVQSAANELPFSSYPVHGTDELLALGARGVTSDEPNVTSLASSIRTLIMAESAADSPFATSPDFSSWRPSHVRSIIEAAYLELTSPAATTQREPLASAIPAPMDKSQHG